jgi:hypothetical protein
MQPSFSTLESLLLRQTPATQTRAPFCRPASTGAQSWDAPLTTKLRRWAPTPSGAKKFLPKPEPEQTTGEFSSREDWPLPTLLLPAGSAGAFSSTSPLVPSSLSCLFRFERPCWTFGTRGDLLPSLSKRPSPIGKTVSENCARAVSAIPFALTFRREIF